MRRVPECESQNMSIAHIMTPTQALTHREISMTSLKPAQRMATKFRFNDDDMDLFFRAAVGGAPAGGLDIGQALNVASTIEDGNAESWVKSFADYGDYLDAQANEWVGRGAKGPPRGRGLHGCADTGQ